MIKSHTTSIEVQTHGTMEYKAALRLMRALHAEIAAGNRPGVLLALNHPPVFTMGRRQSLTGVLGRLETHPDGSRSIDGIPLVATERGGLLTYHDAGQIILYPIIHMPARKGAFRRLVEGLEEAAIGFLSEFGVRGGRRSGQPGVYCPGGGKIASIGLAVQRQTTLHGMAFNIRTDKGNFARIAPCGALHQPIANLADFALCPERVLDLAPRLIERLRPFLETLR